MTFEDAKKTFVDSLKEAKCGIFENGNVLVIGTDSRCIEVKVYEDGASFCVFLLPHGPKAWSGCMTSIKLSYAKAEQIASLGKKTASMCLDALSKKEEDKL